MKKKLWKVENLKKNCNKFEKKKKKKITKNQNKVLL